MKQEKLKVLFIYPNTMMATLLPLNISQLSACLKENEIDVRLFDTTYYKTEKINFEQKKVQLLQLKPYDLKQAGIYFKTTDPEDDLEKLISEYSPDLIAATLVEDTYELAGKLLRKVKKICKIPIIVGGVFAYSSAEMLINESFIDMLCHGEGEEALVELCLKMHKNEDISNIKNIWLKKDNKIIKNPMRPPIDINKLPYLDFDIFDPTRLGRPMHGKVFRMLHVELDRGCPYSCTYCEAPSIAQSYKKCCNTKYYRQKTPERIIAEMKHLKHKYNPNYIDFNSESFLAKPIPSLEKLAEMYRREIDLPFWCQSRPETVTEEKLKILKDMGCGDMQYGIEHGNQEFRKKMLNRNVTNEKMLEACHLTEKFKIPYTVNNIIGFPEETRELIWDTINFNRKINPKTMNCYFFTPYHGTYLYEYCVKNKLLDPTATTMQLLDGGHIKYTEITRQELYGLQRTFSLYARFEKKRWPEIKVAEKFDKKGNEMYEKLAKEFRKRFFS